MGDEPAVGPINTTWGTYLRNPQRLADGVFLCEGQRSLKGTGKVWRPTLVRRHPQAGQPLPYSATAVHSDWAEYGHVAPAGGKYRKGQWKAVLYRYDDATRQHLYSEAYFLTEARCLQFLLHNAQEFLT